MLLSFYFYLEFYSEMYATFSFLPKRTQIKNRAFSSVYPVKWVRGGASTVDVNTGPTHDIPFREVFLQFRLKNDVYIIVSFTNHCEDAFFM